jgi:hypothetical protein
MAPAVTDNLKLAIRYLCQGAALNATLYEEYAVLGHPGHAQVKAAAAAAAADSAAFQTSLDPFLANLLVGFDARYHAGVTGTALPDITALSTALATQMGYAAKYSVETIERGMGHAHAVAKGTEAASLTHAAVITQGVSTALRAFITALDGRYLAGNHGGPAIDLSDLKSMVDLACLAACGTTCAIVESGLGHAAHVPPTAIAANLALTAVIGPLVTWTQALCTLLDARYALNDA